MIGYFAGITSRAVISQQNGTGTKCGIECNVAWEPHFDTKMPLALKEVRDGVETIKVPDRLASLGENETAPSTFGSGGGEQWLPTGKG
jgi:hypothetical protein